eukprot:COSAG01_NODE_1579_length_9829_cov_17.910997_2_plen_303_part_00
MNAGVTRLGDWLMVPLLTLAALCAAYMLACPSELAPVMLGVGVAHCMDTCQAEHSLCYRWCVLPAGPGVHPSRPTLPCNPALPTPDGAGAAWCRCRCGPDEARRQRRLRWQAFSATAGYSSGALCGGAVYELGGFRACAALQLGLCCSLATLLALLPTTHESWSAWLLGRQGRRGLGSRGRGKGKGSTRQGVGGGAGAAEAAGAEAEEEAEEEAAAGRAGSGPAGGGERGQHADGDGNAGERSQPPQRSTGDIDDNDGTAPSSVAGSSGLGGLLGQGPVLVILLCDGLNIFACERRPHSGSL